MTRSSGLSQLVPTNNVWILAEVESGNVSWRDSCEKSDVSNSQVITSCVFAALKESVEEGESFLKLSQLFWVCWSLGKDLWIVIICGSFRNLIRLQSLWAYNILTSESLVQSSHVKVKTLIDNSASFRVFGVKRVVLAVFLDQISQDSTRFPQGESVINQSWNCVLGIDLESQKKSV